MYFVRCEVGNLCLRSLRQTIWGCLGSSSKYVKMELCNLHVSPAAMEPLRVCLKLKQAQFLHRCRPRRNGKKVPSRGRSSLASVGCRQQLSPQTHNSGFLEADELPKCTERSGGSEMMEKMGQSALIRLPRKRRKEQKIPE
jgi:hypothetical protein